MEKDELILYGDLLSQPCRAVAVFLKVTGIPYVLMAPSAKKVPVTLPADQSRINLLQLVPELYDSGFILTESEAILKYLCAKFCVSANWYPADIQQRARIDEFMAWCSMNIHSASSHIYIYQILDPKIKNAPVDRERLRRNKNELDRAIDKLESRFSSLHSDAGFVCDGDISIADIAAACEITQPIAAGYDVLVGRPRVAAWFGLVKSRLEPHFDEVHKALHQTRDLRLRMIYQCSSFDVDY